FIVRVSHPNGIVAIDIVVRGASQLERVGRGLHEFVRRECCDRIDLLQCGKTRRHRTAQNQGVGHFPGPTLLDGRDDGPDDAGRARRLDWSKPGPTLLDGRDDGPDDAGRARRLDWSKLMKRAYAVDVLVCPR